MNSAIVWVLGATAIAAFAQEPTGSRLFIGNAAGVGVVNRLAPGSVGQYSVNFESGPPAIFGSTPTLTLQQPGVPDRQLEVLDTTFLSGRFFVPADTPVGTGTIRFEAQGFRVTGEVEIVPTAPALYAQDFTRVLSAQRAPSFESILLTRPVRPGDTVSFWGTGLGAAPQTDVRATLSGQPLLVQYAGPAPGQRGLDQYNFTVPVGTTLDGSCYSRLDLTVRDVSAPLGFIATSNTDGPCRHPLNLTRAQLSTLDAGGAVPVAQFSLSSQTTGTASLLGMDFSALERHENASALISNLSASAVAMSSAYSTLPASEPGCTSLIGGGSIGLIGGGAQTPADPPPSLGDKVRLAGPSRSFDLTKPADGNPWFDSVGYYLELPTGGPSPYLEQLPDSTFASGQWTLSGNGDKSLEPFRIETDIPGPVRFLEPQALRTMDSTRDVTLQWQTDWMHTADTLNISLIAQRAAQPAVGIVCVSRALDGTLTIPASLLQQLRQTGPQLTLLSVGYIRPLQVTRLQRRDGDPVPATVDWSSFTTIAVTVR